MPGHITTKLQKLRDKEKILTSQRKIVRAGKRRDPHWAAFQKPRRWGENGINYLKCWKKTHTPTWQFCTQSHYLSEGETKTFSDEQKKRICQWLTCPERDVRISSSERGKWCRENLRPRDAAVRAPGNPSRLQNSECKGPKLSFCGMSEDQQAD